MAEKYSFFDAIQSSDGSYDREYSAEDFARYFASFIGNGVYPNPSSNLMVKEKENRTLVVSEGKAWINGYFYENTAPKEITLNIASGTMDRIDRVVVRLDFIQRNIQMIVKEGALSSNPNASSLQRDSNAYEIALADIYVKRNTNEITQANITDLRQNKELCGIVSGVVDQIDTTALFKQYNSTFDAWFENVKGQLSTDVAGNLQNEIDTINTSLNKVSKKTDYVYKNCKLDTGKPVGYEQNIINAYNDGTMELTQILKGRVDFNEPWGNSGLYSGWLKGFSWERAFIEPPTIKSVVNVGTAGAWFDQLKGVTANSMGSYNFVRPTSGTYDMTVVITAVGRFK